MNKVAINKTAERKQTALRRALAEAGRPLPEAVRLPLALKFGADFRQVQIHTGPVADEATRALDANALTFGNHILFRSGMWRPETPSGLELIEHEAVHTLQQAGAVTTAPEARVTEPGDAAERQADAAVEHGVAPGTLSEAVVARRVAGLPPRAGRGADSSQTSRELGLGQPERKRPRRVPRPQPRTTRTSDPARTIEELGRALLDRVRADSQDRSGRVRNQLVRMEDNLRRDVLRWMERHMESHEWRQLVELLADPVPAGLEGTQDEQTQAAAGTAGVEQAPATADEEATTDTGTKDAAAEAAPAAEEVPGTEQPATAEHPASEPEAEPTQQAEQQEGQPQEGAVAKPPIQGAEVAQPQAASEGGSPGPTPQSQAGAVSVPQAPPAPAEQPAQSAPPESAATEAPQAGEERGSESGTHADTAAAHEDESQAAAETESASQTEAASAEATGTQTAKGPEGTSQPPYQDESSAPTATQTVVSASSGAAEASASIGPTPQAEAPLSSTADSTGPAEPVAEAAPVSEAEEPEMNASATSAETLATPAGESREASSETQAIAEPEPAGSPAPAQPEAGMQPANSTAAPEEVAVEPAEPQAGAAAASSEVPAAAPSTPGAVPPALLGEFSKEPNEGADAPASGGGGGGGGGGGVPEAQPEAATTQAPADNPVGAMRSIGRMRVAEASRAMGAATTSVSTQMGTQRHQLESQPPTIERPTGSPQGTEGSTPGNIPMSPPGPDPSPTPVAPAGQAVPLPAGPPAPQPGAPVTQALAAPRVTGTAQGKLSENDAQHVRDAVDNVPVTDEALSVDAGAAPELPLEGDADPAHAEAQQSALLDNAATTQQQGAQDAAAPMGEDHIYPGTQPGTIHPDAGECTCGGGGQTAQRQGAEGPPDAGVAAVAEQERGDQVRQTAAGAADDLGQKQQEQAAEQQQANTESQQQVEQAIEDNAQQQSEERNRARRDVQDSRQQWTEGQQGVVDTARTESDQTVGDARRDISAEQSRAHTEAAGHINTGNQEIARTRADSEQRARAERERAKRESDGGGVLSWLASAVTSFFSRLRDAIHAVFDAARRAVRAAIETAQRLARGVIDLARRAVVGLVQAAGSLLLAIGDRLLAAFPALRARFRAAIESVVNAAVAAVNRLADLLERGITALLNGLLAGLNAILCAYEALYMAIVNTVASAVQGAINFARAAIAALAAFGELVKDIAAGPGQWLSNLGSSIMDGIRNHLWSALKTAVKQWFNDTIEGIVGMGRMLLDLLRRGGLSLRKIAGFVWQAIIASLPGIIIQFLIERLISMLIPAAGAILLIIQGLIAAWGAVQRIIQAFQLFFVFLKAVRRGGAGPQFATALAASAVALIQFLAMFLLARLARAAGGVAGRLRALAQRLMAFFRRAVRAVGRVVRRVGRAVMRGARALGRLARRGMHALRRVLRRTRFGRALLRGIRRIRRGIRNLRERFRRWRERRRQRRRQNAQERLERAVAAIRPQLSAMLRRGVGHAWLRARLGIWQLRYRLSALRIQGRQIIAKVNPEEPLVEVNFDANLGSELEPILVAAEEAFLTQYQESRMADDVRALGMSSDQAGPGYVRRSAEMEDILSLRSVRTGEQGLRRHEPLTLRSTGVTMTSASQREHFPWWDPNPARLTDFRVPAGPEASYAAIQRGWAARGMPSIAQLRQSRSLRTLALLERARGSGMLPTMDIAMALGQSGRATAGEVTFGELAPMAPIGASQSTEDEARQRLMAEARAAGHPPPETIPGTAPKRDPQQIQRARDERHQRIANIFRRLRAVIHQRLPIATEPGISNLPNLARAFEAWLRVHVRPGSEGRQEASLALAEELRLFLHSYRGG